VPERFSRQGAIRRITGLGNGPILLRYGLLNDVTQAIILIERLDAAGINVCFKVSDPSARKSSISTSMPDESLTVCWEV